MVEASYICKADCSANASADSNAELGDFLLNGTSGCCIQGPEPSNFDCVLGVQCSLKITRMPAHSSPAALISPDDDVACGDPSRVADWTGPHLRNPANPFYVPETLTAVPSTLQSYEFGIPLTGHPGVFRLCWGSESAAGMARLEGQQPAQCRGMCVFFINLFSHLEGGCKLKPGEAGMKSWVNPQDKTSHTNIDLNVLELYMSSFLCSGGIDMQPSVRRVVFCQEVKLTWFTFHQMFGQVVDGFTFCPWFCAHYMNQHKFCLQCVCTFAVQFFNQLPLVQLQLDGGVSDRTNYIKLYEYNR